MIKAPKDRAEVVRRIWADVQYELPSSAPKLMVSFLRALCVAFAGAVWDWYRTLMSVPDNVMFDDSCDEETLLRKAAEYGVYRASPLAASGTVALVGSAGSVVSAKQLIKKNDRMYEVQDEGSVSVRQVGIKTLTRVGTTAIAETTSEHCFGGGMPVTVSGVTPVGYNGTVNVTVVDSTHFSYVVDQSLAASGSGSMLAFASFAAVFVQALESGADGNVPCGDVLSLATAVAGVESDVYVCADGLSGGADIEDIESLRERYRFRKQNPVSNFNDNAIIHEARKIGYVNRVFVKRVCPSYGQTTVYVTKKGAGISLSAAELSTVKDQILTINPAQTSEDDVFVVSPTLVPVNFRITAITPATEGIKVAVESELYNYILSSARLGQSMSIEEIRATIFNTRDSTGAKVQAFTLAMPAADVAIADGSLAKMGSVSWV